MMIILMIIKVILMIILMIIVVILMIILMIIMMIIDVIMMICIVEAVDKARGEGFATWEDHFRMVRSQHNRRIMNTTRPNLSLHKQTQHHPLPIDDVSIITIILLIMSDTVVDDVSIRRSIDPVTLALGQWRLVLAVAGVHIIIVHIDIAIIIDIVMIVDIEIGGQPEPGQDLFIFLCHLWEKRPEDDRRQARQNLPG